MGCLTVFILFAILGIISGVLDMSIITMFVFGAFLAGLLIGKSKV
jgi:hypothetical protein